MTFRQNISRFVTGEIDLRVMPAIAIQAMEEEGLDTPSLCILAGLSADEAEYIKDQYFKAALRELNIELPDKRKAAIEVGLAIAIEIIEGKRAIFEGVQEIKWKAIDAYPFYEETKHYCYDSIGFEKAYGLFVTIDDLRSSGSTQWQEDKTNEQLEEEVSKDLLAELKVWIERIQNDI